MSYEIGYDTTDINEAYKIDNENEQNIKEAAIPEIKRYLSTIYNEPYRYFWYKNDDNFLDFCCDNYNFGKKTITINCKYTTYKIKTITKEDSYTTGYSGKIYSNGDVTIKEDTHSYTTEEKHLIVTSSGYKNIQIVLYHYSIGTDTSYEQVEKDLHYLWAYDGTYKRITSDLEQHKHIRNPNHFAVFSILFSLLGLLCVAPLMVLAWMQMIQNNNNPESYLRPFTYNIFYLSGAFLIFEIVAIIIEIKKRKKFNDNNYGNDYYFKLITEIVTVLCSIIPVVFDLNMDYEKNQWALWLFFGLLILGSITAIASIVFFVRDTYLNNIFLIYRYSADKQFLKKDGISEYLKTREKVLLKKIHKCSHPFINENENILEKPVEKIKIGPNEVQLKNREKEKEYKLDESSIK